MNPDTAPKALSLELCDLADLVALDAAITGEAKGPRRNNFTVSGACRRG